MFIFGTADDVFAMAIRIKENGRRLYTGAAEGSEDPVQKRLFEDLAALEDDQIRVFKSLRARFAEHVPDEEEAWDPEGLARSYLEAAADTHVFTQEAATERLKEVKTAPQALEMAIQFEKDSVHFFLGMKEILPDAKGKDDLDGLITEEMDRIARLAQAKKTCLPTRCEIVF
jgi:rubrerythrin